LRDGRSTDRASLAHVRHIEYRSARDRQRIDPGMSPEMLILG